MQKEEGTSWTIKTKYTNTQASKNRQNTSDHWNKLIKQQWRAKNNNKHTTEKLPTRIKLQIQKVFSSSEETPENDAVGKTKHSPKYTSEIVNIKPSNKKEKSNVKISENVENHYPIKVIQKKDIFSLTGDECLKSIRDC